MKNRFWLAFGLIFVVSGFAFGQTKQTKTITNFELEKFKQTREKGEDEYRKTYKERGLPSPEELEAQRREAKRQNEESIRRSSFARQQNQGYYQIQANNLRTQLISIEGQMRYLNSQISNLPAQNSIFLTPEQYNQTVILQNGYYGGYYGGQPNYPNQVNTVNPATSVQSVINQSAGNPNPFWGTPLYPSSVKLVIGQQNQPRQRGYHRPYYGGGYAIPVPVNSNNAQREELISRYRNLGQVRAGLIAQWNNLAEEARRVGVRIN